MGNPIKESWFNNVTQLSYFQFHSKVQKIIKTTIIRCIQGTFNNGEVSLHFPDETELQKYNKQNFLDSENQRLKYRPHFFEDKGNSATGFNQGFIELKVKKG